MWNSSDGVVIVAQSVFVVDKRKQDAAVCGVVHPSSVDDMFRFAIKYNLKQIFSREEQIAKRKNMTFLMNVTKLMRITQKWNVKNLFISIGKLWKMVHKYVNIELKSVRISV